MLCLTHRDAMRCFVIKKVIINGLFGVFPTMKEKYGFQSFIEIMIGKIYSENLISCDESKYGYHSGFEKYSIRSLQKYFGGRLYINFWRISTFAVSKDEVIFVINKKKKYF